MKNAIIKITLALSTLFFLTSGFADSVIDGVYVSPSDENGLGACELTISSLSEEPKYGDQLFRIESSGDGACEWSAIGMSKSSGITAGSVTSGGVQTFVKLAFPFGPAGKRIQLTSYDVDGSLRNEEMFIQSDPDLYSAE